MDELRLGDIIDDYCIKCRRLTNHAIVSIVEGEAAKVRCRSCYHDHTYLREQIPPSKKDLKKGEKMSKNECELVLDRLLTIEFDNNPELASVPPELRKQVMQQAKDQARQKDSADCNATKAQYKCAMATTTKAQWMACMK